MVRVNTESQRCIVLNMDANGVARLIFETDRRTFTGILETSNGETISINGKVTEGAPEPHTCSEPYIMDIFIVDGEAGSSFKLSSVHVFMNDLQVSIENPAIKFSTEQRFIGAKADVVIQQYMQPSMTDDKKEVYVGPMKVHEITVHQFVLNIGTTSTEVNQDLQYAWPLEYL
ncbi:unnamed protein product [Angiostrongylus costaricensis]|uniref:PITH domain-containing protein n=1 Tax=Angiostrongylus costaricensis TaxID=334426 RepID=A0A158PEK9_ANGCS|nr:unnamed protein product [Angiostrongylus costaricensis]